MKHSWDWVLGLGVAEYRQLFRGILLNYSPGCATLLWPYSAGHMKCSLHVTGVNPTTLYVHYGCTNAAPTLIENHN